MTLSLYIDEDSMHSAVVRALRALGHDVLTTADAGNVQAPDDEQLRFASAQGRTIVTANRGDFARLHSAWAEAGREHAGIIVLTHQRTPVGVLVRKLARLAESRQPSQMTSYLFYLNGDPNQRIE